MSLRSPFSRLGAAVAMLALAAGSLHAQEDATGFSKQLKLRGAYALQTKDNLRPGSFGIGFNVTYGCPMGRFGVEMGYYTKAGDQYQEPLGAQVPAGFSPVNYDKSGDSRRNSLEGFAVRVSYQQRINDSWDWQAGMMIGGTRFKHEYRGDVQSQDWNEANTHAWRDDYSGTPAEGGMKVSPYVGVSMKMSASSSLEMNVMALNYSAINYVHHPGSAHSYPIPGGAGSGYGGLSAPNDFPGDRLEKSTRWMPHVEFAYVLRF